MNIFEFAMEKEKYSCDYYQSLSGKAQSKGLARIFSMLADEEAKHYGIVEQMKNEKAEDIPETTVLSDAKDVFSQMRRGAEQFNLDISQIEAYKKARKIEKESREFYLEKASQAANERQKDIFEKLAEEERAHYFLLDDIIELVSRPQQWLEDAEFYHLDEY